MDASGALMWRDTPILSPAAWRTGPSRRARHQRLWPRWPSARGRWRLDVRRREGTIWRDAMRHVYRRRGAVVDLVVSDEVSRRSPRRFQGGELAEWLKAHAWRAASG